jgi:hypothetical protein
MNVPNINGRPFGGQAWIYPKKFDLLDNNFLSRYVSYIHLKINEQEILLVGAYMPFDNSKNKKESHSLFEVSLSLIATLICKAQSNDIPIFIIGDFNADLKRKNKFDKILKLFTENYYLTHLTSEFPQNISHTFTSKNNGNYFKHQIDHAFFINDSSISITIERCNILDNDSNTSDHNAISLEFSFPNKHTKKQITQTSQKLNENIDFENCEILEFYNSQLEYILTKYEPESQQVSKQSQIDSMYKKITLAVVQAKRLTIEFQNKLKPKIKISNSNNKKWFTPELKQIKNELMQLKYIYQQNRNFEIENQISNLKTSFRRIQRQNILIIEKKELDKFENLAKEKNKNKFWRFINNNKKKRSTETSPTISPQNLLNHYSKFFFEKTELTAEQKLIEISVSEKFNNYKVPEHPPLFSLAQIEFIIKDLKEPTVSGNDSLTYSLIKNATSPSFKMALVQFFNKFITLNRIPNKLNHSIIKPIIKDQKKSTNDTNNIRPISISNCLSQIFEKLILLNSPALLKIHKNQFGFKRKTSCNHALFVMKETVLRYLNNKSSCKIASLDAEKAFDKVWRDGLFHKLYNKMDPTFWNLLKRYYDSSQGVILNPDFSSFSEFPINCGVKQGGILSPFLFNVFIDELITSCLDLNVGALFHTINMSIIVYADDILLISPVDFQLQKLLDVCTEYSEKWRIKFNTSKSNIITFGEPLFENSFKLNNKILNETENIEYLGTKINNKFEFDTLSQEKFLKVQKSIFSLSYLGLTPKGVNPALKAFIYKTYCLSQFTYGLETTTLKTETRDFLNISQNNLIRQFIGIKKYNHMSNVLKSLNLYNFHELYISTKLSFLETIKNNELSMRIFEILCRELDRTPKKSQSFSKDILLLQSHFGIDIELIFAGPSVLKRSMKMTFKERDGLTDSITLCLANIKIGII